MGKPLILATSREDVALLGRCFATIPQADRWKVMGHVHDLGLMKFRGPMRALLWLVKATRGTAGVLNFFRLLDQRAPHQVSVFVAQTIEHIVLGKDREDADSVGGLSQREIDLLLSRVTFSLLTEAGRAALATTGAGHGE